MIVDELIALLQDCESHYSVLIWDEREQDWSYDLVGKLLVRDEHGVVLPEKKSDKKETA